MLSQNRQLTITRLGLPVSLHFRIPEESGKDSYVRRDLYVDRKKQKTVCGLNIFLGNKRLHGRRGWIKEGLEKTDNEQW